MPLPSLPDDALLYAVSARRRLSWGDFKKLYESILTAEAEALMGTNPSPYVSAQALDMLAHCDLTFEGGRGMLYVAPQTLARLPVGGLPRALLVGARAPATIPALKAAAADHKAEIVIRNHEANLPLLPLRVTILAENKENLQAIAVAAGVDFEPVPPAWKLIEGAGTLDEYLDLQPERSGELEGWRSAWFDPETLRFLAEDTRERGAQLARQVHPVTQQERYFWRRVGRWQEVDKNWGRYAALREANIQALAYDSKRFILAVPLLASLPRVIARALCLCSGFAPRVIQTKLDVPMLKDQPRVLFQWIPPDMAEMAARKLGQLRLVHAHINI